MKTLAVVPMREGSKGLPGKNLMKINGEYLVDIVARTVLKSNRFDIVMCSTDSQQIANLARQAGLEVPFIRPAELSGDTVPTSTVISHSLRFLKDEKNLNFTYVFVFQVTSPFITVDLINRAFETLDNDKTVDSVICGSPVPEKYHAELQFGISSGGVVRPAVEGATPRRRQDMPKTFLRCGNLYATRVDALTSSGSLVSGKVKAVIVEPHLSLDIDSAEDLKEANERLANVQETY